MNDLPNPLEMWSYWRGKYGEVEALETYYAKLLERDPVLAYAKAQVEAGLLAINARMERLIDEHGSDE